MTCTRTSELLGQLAELTTLRDRSALDHALVNTLNQWLEPDSLGVYRLVGPPSNERWLTSAWMERGVFIPQGHQASLDLEELPSIGQFPQRQLALQQHQSVAGDTTHVRVYPLRAQTTNGGVVEICSPALNEETRPLITAVLALYQNFLGLLDYGERDALTDLLNRKTFDGTFLKATNAHFETPNSRTPERRQTAEIGSYWLAMLDIDHFKQVNDNFGHLIGDEVLLLLARLMRDSFRFHDQLYRFGGEEFVVLMYCAETGHAQAALERLRQNTEAHNFPQVGHITVSIGFTEVLVGDTPSAAFERADKAVYFAKEHGRNQVFGFEALVAQGKLLEVAANVGDIELF
jgi:diguanylate cyclase (GGDEF)-like protein